MQENPSQNAGINGTNASNQQANASNKSTLHLSQWK
jgi:hypothetical protein